MTGNRDGNRESTTRVSRRALLLSCLLAAAAFSQPETLGVFSSSGDVGGPSRKGSTELLSMPIRPTSTPLTIGGGC
jgi:hypothetical protein